MAIWCAAIVTSPKVLKIIAPVLKILTSKKMAKPMGKPSFKIRLIKIGFIFSKTLSGCVAW